MKSVDFSHWCRKTTGVAVVAVVGALAAWAVSSASVAQSSAGQVRTATTRIDRAPNWVNAPDPHSTFSGAVAVYPKGEEIVVQSPGQVFVFDRRANTPARAALTEPKRLIEGPATGLDDLCGLYVDPKTGEIYNIANDISNVMTVFGPTDKGNVAPRRKLITPQPTYGMSVDDKSQEIFMAVAHPPAVFVFDKAAEGNDPALRILEGYHTQLKYPHGIAVDPENELMFVVNHGAVADSYGGLAWRRWPVPQLGGKPPMNTRWGIPCQNVPGIECQNGGEWYREFPGNRYKFLGRGTVIPGSGRYDPPSITVYPIKADGDAAPLRVIEGPKAQLNWPMHIVADSEHGEIYVANAGGSSILVFRITDEGDVAPIRTIKGPQTRLKNPVGVYVDNVNDELVVSDVRTYSVNVFRRTADGDTAPLRVIRNAPLGVEAPSLGQPTGIAYDARRDQILVPN